jgi:hypothetical protein
MLLEYLIKLKDSINSEALQVHYDPLKKVAAQKEILFGIGEHEDGGLLLSNKIEGKRADSVSQYVVEQSDEFYQKWQETLKDNLDLKNVSIYIEDLSPDTIYSIILFFSRLNNIPFSAFPSKWLPYVNRWEKGDMRTTGEMEKSWGVLLSSLAHEYFVVTNVEEQNNNRIYKYDQQKVVDGFRICLAFTIDLILNSEDPAEIPVSHHSEGYNRAISLFNIEKLEYENTLRNSSKLQLLLPLKNSSRRVFIDSIITTEINVLATLKNYSRTDVKNSFFKMGFGLMAVHRPHIAGSGNDIVISVDPSTGVHLKELWETLENLENTRWEGKRPNHSPRSGYKVNQPWFNENERFTMVAAPRTLTNEDKLNLTDPSTGKTKLIPIVPPGEVVLGSKLSWEDVLNQLWKLYNPVRELRVHSYEVSGNWGEESKIVTIKPIQNGQSKKFIGLKWAKTNSQNTMVITPTFKRYLVACLNNVNGEPMIHDLPNEKSFDYLEVPGGFALIHNEGVIFFDDWSNEGSNIKSYYEEFNRLLNRNDAIHRFRSRIKSEVQDIMEKIKDKRKMRKEIVLLSSNLAGIKIELQNSIFETMSKSNVYDVNNFRQVIERRWNLNTQLNELYSMVSEIESTIKSIVDSRTNRVIRTITIVGFPLSIFSGIFQESIKNVFLEGIFDTYHLITFLVVTGISMFLLWNWVDQD